VVASLHKGEASAECSPDRRRTSAEGGRTEQAEREDGEGGAIKERDGRVADRVDPGEESALHPVAEGEHGGNTVYE